MGFFVMLIAILRIKLFFLQVIQSEEYQKDLIDIHATKSTLKAKRWHIYTINKGGKMVKLTENIDYYTIFVDPQFVHDKPKVIEILTPIVYEHLCELNGIVNPTKYQCLNNLQSFVRKDILPPQPQFFYQTGTRPEDTWANIQLEQWYSNVVIAEQEKYDQHLSGVINSYQTGQIQTMISQRLQDMIKWGKRELNYVGFFDDVRLRQSLWSGEYQYIVREDNYLYLKPSLISNPKKVAQTLFQILKNHGHTIEYANLLHQSQAQENNYVQIAQNVNATIANKLIQIKTESVTRSGYTHLKTPLLHWLWLNKTSQRYYPHGQFMSHVLGFVDSQGQWHYGAEEYFQELLAGQDGAIVWLAGQGIGTVGTNDFIIQEAQDGKDVILTIDPVIQTMGEQLASKYTQEFRADSIAITIMNPRNGQIKALVNSPSFDPNFPNKEYQLIPLGYEHRYILDDITYIDHPVFVLTGNQLKLATSEQRFDPQYPKYISKNGIWPQVFIDKNIASPYEPGSIFKAITVGIGLDSDTISLQDTYFDKWYAEIWPYKIKNVDIRCIGENSFMWALMYSCNVGMINIVKRVDMPIFYNYLEKLWFGELTHIELAWEDQGDVPNITTTSRTQFLNNSFWQGLTVTPMQIASAYASLVNGGVLVKPTIVHNTTEIAHLHTQSTTHQWSQIFKHLTTQLMKDALYKVVYDGQVRKFSIPGYSLAGKTGTSQIAYKGKYQKWLWRTNGSFAGTLTKDNLNYVIIIQIRRPRTVEWWENTAGKIYGDIAKFLIQYDAIDR